MASLIRGEGLLMMNLLSDRAKEKGQSAYIAGEALYTNGGPFDVPEHFNRYNLFGKFITKLGTNNALTFTLSTLESKWRAAGEIPKRALAEGYIKDPFGSIDSSQGGYTTKTNANLKLTSFLKKDFTWENQVFYSYCYFNLISNFTFYYADPVHGMSLVSMKQGISMDIKVLSRIEFILAIQLYHLLPELE